MSRSAVSEHWPVLAVQCKFKLKSSPLVWEKPVYAQSLLFVCIGCKVGYLVSCRCNRFIMGTCSRGCNDCPCIVAAACNKASLAAHSASFVAHHLVDIYAVQQTPVYWRPPCIELKGGHKLLLRWHDMCILFGCSWRNRRALMQIWVVLLLAVLPYPDT